MEMTNHDLQTQLEDVRVESQRLVSTLQTQMLEDMTEMEAEVKVLRGQRDRILAWGVRVLRSKHAASLVRHTLMHWRHHVRIKSVRESKLRNVLTRFAHASLARAWRKWIEAVEINRRSRHLLKNVLCRLTHRSLTSSFYAWKVCHHVYMFNTNSPVDIYTFR
jgi:isochorismate synthase EntC